MNFIKTFLAGLLAVVVGTFLVFFLWIFILLGIAGSMEKSVAVHPESILKIDFSEVLTDAPSSDPLAGLDLMTLQTQRQLPLLKALRALEAARDDDRIKGIYLRMNGTGGVTGSAILEELREALVEFKQSGKFIVAYNETYSQGGYYLASVADKIYMQPEGMMEWAGLSMNLMFYKGLLDKLDLKAEVFRPTACKYKSAVEPYIYDKMSDANREQMQQLVSSMWGVIAESVAEARGIELKTLNEMADRLEVALPGEALEKGLVDSLIYEDQMEDVFAELGVSDDYDFVTLGDYAAQVGADLKNISADQVAVVYADGQIVDGEGYGRAVYGNTLAATLAEFDKVYGAHMHDKTAPYPGMPALLARLKAAGVRMAVFSNKADEFARAVVARYFDADLFEVVRGALPDVPTKPAPEGTRALMARLGVEADGSVLYVGDSNVDVETAHNAGLPCCGVLWGFRTREELTEAGAEYLAEDTQGLEKVVLG